MLLRKKSEEREHEILSDFAAKAAESRGRKKEEEKCEFRTDFQRDRDRIIYSKALRRMMHKTQVFLAPEGDHFRTRLTHTLEVAQISRTIARALRLNEDLTEAIAMGHDLGHTPFGHNGEAFLAEKHPGGFSHNQQSLRVVDVLESSETRQGMNLTEEVRDGIVCHTGKKLPFTLEGQVMRISDRIAYINHDIDDALRCGVITQEELPADCVEILGRTTTERINALVRDMVENSDGEDFISQGEECSFYMNKLRDFMFENVYYSNIVKRDEELDKVRRMLFSLYDHYMENPQELPAEFTPLIEAYGLAEIVKDHIASMTDRYAINRYVELFVPQGWKRNSPAPDKPDAAERA
ncbi:MAG: deoxyguanosinetriphosphate triphosphohydrolase [Clostridiales Family XIII bacterium]|jgi:dGTPase|nr:deoxyguanosinetriphosphate triphosphohydrolase [Clostridiales Family XIII bacterium]